MSAQRDPREETIIGVVLDILQTEGFDAVQVRVVAKRARVAPNTIYQLFGPMDQLIVTAVQEWMDTNAYAELKVPDSDEPPYATAMKVMRAVFEPWERNPRMLEAFRRAGLTRAGRARGGDTLIAQGTAVTGPIIEAAFKDLDPELVSDMAMIVGRVLRSAIDEFAAGELAVTEIVPIVERTLLRLIGSDERATCPQVM